MKPTLKCSKCHETFRREEIIEYASPGCKTLQKYCPKCYQEKLDFDNFRQTISNIFGKDTNWPRINQDRKKLKEKYGYTDKTIIDCLEYLYNIKKCKKLSESLILVTPVTIEEMMKEKRAREYRKNIFEEAINTNYKVEYYQPRENNNQENIQLDNPNDFI